jgi:hypothetical protein
MDTATNMHPSIKPVYRNEFTTYDSIVEGLNINSKSKLLSTVSNSGKIEDYANSISITAMPVLNAGYGMEQTSSASEGLHEFSAGLNIKSHAGKKWSGQFVYLWDFSNYPSYIDAMIASKNISPGYGYTSDDKSYYTEGNLTFTADDNFAFQLGYGKNFIGDGYRSLFLSDNAFSYPYFKVTANIWKIKYLALFTNMQDIQGTDGSFGDSFHKFSSIHYLSYNATKWLNIGFFESIVWQAQEDEFYRGFDINYLNPVIFMRPIEYSQGSSDNALLGMSLKARIKKNNILYSQLVLDEFLLAELKAGNGWWANKYGIQLGLKSYDFLWVKNLSLQLEYNMVRPFTYSYYHNPTNISTLQNYGHYNAPLAHPLGANFTEVFASLTYQKKRWLIEGMSTFARVGLDTNSTSSVGQDVYLPYNLRAQGYGYETGGGLATDIMSNTLKVSYLINAKSQMMLNIGVTNRMYKNSGFDANNNIFFIGLKTGLINRYNDI